MEGKKIEMYINFLLNRERKKQKLEREKTEKRKKKKSIKIINLQNKNNKIIPFIDYISSPKYKLNLARYYTKLYLEEYFKILEIREKNKRF